MVPTVRSLVQSWPDGVLAREGAAENGTVFALAGAATTLLFVIVWAAWWRRRPDFGGKVRGYCWIALSLWWGFITLLGIRLSAVVTAGFLLRHPLLAGAITATFFVCGIRTFVRSGHLRS